MKNSTIFKTVCIVLAMAVAIAVLLYTFHFLFDCHNEGDCPVCGFFFEIGSVKVFYFVISAFVLPVLCIGASFEKHILYISPVKKFVKLND